MKIARFLACSLAMVPLASSHSQTAAAESKGAQAPRHAASEVSTTAGARLLLNEYCVSCHNARLKTAGLDLESADVSNVATQTELWEKVMLKLRAGEMPPAGRPRPDTATYEALKARLERDLDQAAAARPDPGRPAAFRRLNRDEYRRVVRDLLALDVDDRKIAELLPADDVSYGFDNTAGVRMSPMLMERYVSAAEKISRLAVGASAGVLTGDTFTVAENLSQNDWLEGLPFGTRGGAAIKHYFPVDGTYEIAIKLGRYNFSGTGGVPNYDTPQPLEFRIDGERVHVFTQPAVDVEALRTRSREQRQADAASPPRQPGRDADQFKDVDADWHMRFSVKAGPRTITLAWLNRTPTLSEHFRYSLRPYPGASDPGEGSYYRNRSGAYLNAVDLRGPFDAVGPGDTPSRRRIFICNPQRTSDEPACARSLITTLAKRAYRRPLVSGDITALMTFYQTGRIDQGFEAGIESALQALLVSPEFLYRVERVPPKTGANATYKISDLELASRLSFFLWSSIPDDELLELAIRQKLSVKGTLEQQVRRMLAHPRSEALVANFAGQWLYLRNVAGVTPDPMKDPDFDDGLRQAFRKETALFVQSIIDEDRSILDLVGADYTFVNERLARHYGIGGVYGDHFRRVSLVDPRRRGLLGQGSILTVTSYPDRTSPVLRGKWVLENLLGTPPGDPPPNVPSLDDNRKKIPSRTPTMRELMALHRANPVCATCHSRMDPIGLALESFDFDGRLRTREGDSDTLIDTSGVLPNGHKFNGIVELRQSLLNAPDLLTETLTKKLMTYALGRGMTHADMPAVRAIRREANATNLRLSSIILGIASSVPFQMRQATAPEPASAKSQ